MFTPEQARAYDAWRTAGPPEDPNEEIYATQADMDLHELTEELEDLMFAGDESPTTQAAAADAARHNAYTLLKAELTRLEDSPEIWDEDGKLLNPDDPIHAAISDADALIGKTLRYHPSYQFL